PTRFWRIASLSCPDWATPAIESLIRCITLEDEQAFMRTLLSKEDLHDGVTRMADKIAACYENRQLTIVGVLTGSVVLMADLIRVLDLPMRVGVLQASSYRGATTTRGELVINSELMLDISGRDVLLAAIFLASAVMNHIPKFADITNALAAKGIPAPAVANAIAIALMLLGGVSLVIGYKARLGATMLLVFLVLAAYFFHDFWHYQ